MSMGHSDHITNRKIMRYKIVIEMDVDTQYYETDLEDIVYSELADLMRQDIMAAAKITCYCCGQVTCGYVPPTNETQE